jgi:hypothetical protein
MCYNPIEIDLWKVRVAEAERKAMLAYRTRDLKSPERLLWERLLAGARRLLNVRLQVHVRPMRYAGQQE